MIGTKLAHYEITSHLGTGGMGEVYQAVDSKLGRNVAIKILPEAFSRDRDRSTRFEREARLLASLNHPNIAGIHGLEDSGETKFLVLELIEGDTLADRLRHGSIPPDEAVKLALQIAHAIEAAHEKGVIHRDIKPANIKITPEGKIKVLDFGLAKAFSTDDRGMNLSNSPTISMAATQQGIILGTAGYMSPEQASGQVADKRADIWSFGVVLFEMLTGGPLYTGKTVSHVLADVLRADPDWNRLPVNLHPRIRMLLERCLEKDPRDRYHDIADARVDLEHVLADPGGVFIQTAPDAAHTKQAGSRVFFWGCIAASALVASSLGWFLRPAPIAIPASVVRFPFVLPDPTQLPTQPVSLLAISPDGTKIAYAANAQIYLRNLNETVARPIPGTNEGGTGPGALVFSPDGMTLGYVHVVTLTGPFFIKRVPVSGGTPVKLNEAPPGLRNFQYGLSWPTLDTMVYANADGIVKITANGGSPEVLVKRVAGESFESPQMLPGGKQILFTRLTEEPGGTGVARWDAAEIVIQSAGGNDRTVVWKGGSHARYLQTGHLLYALGNTLFAISLDLTSRKVIGSPIPILEGVQRSSNGFSDVAQYAVSDSGVVVSMPATNTNNPEKGILGLVDRNGVTTPFAVQPAQYRGPRLSPDEKQLAVEINGDDGKSSIWIYDMSGKSEIRRLTEAGTISTRPIWTRDGKWITFGSQRDGAWGIYQIPADGSALAKRLFAAKDKIKVYPESWSPDGKTLTFAQITSSDTDWDIWTFSTSDAVTSLVAGGPGSQFGSSFSPDGRWIVYTDNQDPFGLRAQPFPTTGVIHQLTQDGEAWPVWTTGGRIISRFRRDSGGRAQLREVQVNASNEITLNNPHTIPLPDALIYQNYRDFAVTKSGEAFVALLPEQKLGKTNPSAAPTFRIDVILNWFEELKQRIPSK